MLNPDTRRVAEFTHVQGKRHTRVGDEDEESDAVEGVERLETLSEGDDDGVDDGADGGVVVERDDGVHLTAVSEGPSERKHICCFASDTALTLRPWRRSWIMTSLEASKAMAAHWHKKPNISKWTSP